MTTPDPKYKHKPSEKHTLEEVLKSLQDLIRNDLVEAKASEPVAEANDHREKSVQQNEPATLLEQIDSAHADFAPTTPGSGPVNFDAVMQSLQNLIANELDVDETSPVPNAEITPPLDPVVLREALATPTEETVSMELLSLDEALTLDESLQIDQPPPASTVAESLEFPGEISLELLNEPEPPAPTVAADTAIQNIVPPPDAPEITNIPSVEVMQQKLILDEAPVLLAQKPEPLIENSESIPASEPDISIASPEVNFEDLAVELTPAENTDSPPAEALPTIEVDESFDENDYLNAVTELNAAPPPAIQETVAANDATIVAASAPPGKKIILEIVNEPPLENSLSEHTIDFDSIDSTMPDKQAAADSTKESPAEKESPQTQTGTTATSSIKSPVLTVTAAPPLAVQQEKIKTATTPAPTTLDSPAIQSVPPLSLETSAPKTKSPINENQHSFPLDDIPVLQEVVAPPAGSSLTPTKPPAPVKKPASPESGRARDIVVRAVAKLNIEMRKSGSAGLDTKTILRLQQLMRAELEKDDKK